MAMSMELILQVCMTISTLHDLEFEMIYSNLLVILLIKHLVAKFVVLMCIVNIFFFLPGIDSADILINCAQKKMCKYHVPGKYE
jgi:uncharacterized membrane protein YhaH (DUF805 family)